jgi:hypothetical protein
MPPTGARVARWPTRTGPIAMSAFDKEKMFDARARAGARAPDEDIGTNLSRRESDLHRARQ